MKEYCRVDDYQCFTGMDKGWVYKLLQEYYLNILAT
jgi:hypothetical protein